MREQFRLTRLCVDDAGHTYYAEDMVPFDGELAAPPAQPAGLAAVGPAESVAVMVADRDWGGQPLHPAPHRQLLTVIAGSWQVTTSLGDTRTFEVGDTVLLEDTSGHGHSSRALDDGSMAVVTVLATG